MNIKETALKVWDDNIIECAPENLNKFAEALIAELAKENEPVAWWNGKETAFFEHEVDGPVGEVRIPLYTLPPPASQIANKERVEQETAEACAKVCTSYYERYDGTTEDCFDTVHDAAKAIRSGAWKEFK